MDPADLEAQELTAERVQQLNDELGNVLASNQEAWTSKGKAAFTPIEIMQRRHKIDLSFYPDEIMDSWLGFMGDESIDRKAWPISKYIIEQLIIPKVSDNRELVLISKGTYVAPEEGTAQALGLSMDGFVTILRHKHSQGNSNINFIQLESLTADNIFDQLESFGEQVGDLYKDMSMNIFLSRKWFSAYHRKRRDLHGTDTNYDGMKTLLEGTNLTLTSLPSMAGEEVIFTTPKENFIRLMNRNNGASSISVESVDRQIKVFADWYESVGFGIEEAVFAFVPET